LPAVRALLLVLCAGAAGCGGSSGEGATAVKTPPPAPCEIGKSISSHLTAAPAAWTSGPRPAIALTCSADRVDSGAAIAGYPIPGGGSCVSAYSSRLEEAFGELCETSGTGWTAQCERRGCVHYFRHEQSSTVVAGPVAGGISGAWVSIDGKQVVEGVIFTAVHGKRLAAIGAKEPFGYFAAYIPRCVEPEEVKIHMATGGSKQIGLADEWDVAEAKCPAGS
jgi:hypothetical protein